MTTANLITKALTAGGPLGVRGLARRTGVSYEAVRYCLNSRPDLFCRTPMDARGWGRWTLTQKAPGGPQTGPSCPSDAHEVASEVCIPRGRLRRSSAELARDIRDALRDGPQTARELGCKLGMSAQGANHALTRMYGLGRVAPHGTTRPPGGIGRPVVRWGLAETAPEPDPQAATESPPVGIPAGYRTPFEVDPRAPLLHKAFTGPLPVLDFLTDAPSNYIFGISKCGE